MVVGIKYFRGAGCSQIFCLKQIIKAVWYSTDVNTQSAVHVTMMSKHLVLRQMRENLDSKEEYSRPLVLFYQWAGAKPPSVEKYCSLYHQKGMDVLTIKGTFIHIVWPKTALKLAEELLEYLSGQNRLYLVHAISIGVYNYTLTRMLCDGCEHHTQGFSNRLIGHIFDSVVIGKAEHFSKALTHSFSNNNFLQFLMIKYSEFYMGIAKKPHLYEKSFVYLKEKPLHLPSLFFYSENDPFCHIPSLREIICTWKVKHGVETLEKSWKISEHAGHLRFNHQDYMSSWEMFMKRLGF